MPNKYIYRSTVPARRKRRGNFLPFVLAIIAVTLTAVGIGFAIIYKGGSQTASDGGFNTAKTDSSSAADPVSSASAVEISSAVYADVIPDFSSKPPESELDRWYLRLVNKDTNVLPASFHPEVSPIRNEYVMKVENGNKKFDAVEFSSQAIAALHALFDAAKADGIKLESLSAYRSYDTQKGIFERNVNNLLASNKSITRAQAEEQVAMTVARPGTSEHSLGLAVDFNSVEVSFENTSAFLWLQNHAADYGFILRYPKDKVDVTKYSYEPWHYRYVTAAHAKQMKRLGMCMEEYAGYLES
ncbi:MAG: M15 family metallopeptidase [Oscillospiraceae bacterium]|nr:M15 family metallopeptidase [Oscillospiraceae bacterium]